MAQQLQLPVLGDNDINRARPGAPGNPVTVRDVVLAAKYVRAVEIAQGSLLSIYHQQQ
jgi:hypothetical protein